MGVKYSLCIEGRGFTGGIWLCWCEESFEVRELERDDQFEIARLEGIQRKIGVSWNPFLEELQCKLEEEMEEMLRQEEVFWFLKSRGEWLRSGDRNTKYYHLKVMGRRRWNKIHMLKNERGIWVDEKEELVEMVKSYFVDLFTEEKVAKEWVVTEQRWGLVEKERLEAVGRSLNREEVTRDLFSMDAFKAPGEDGFPAGFFQRS